MDTLGKGGVFDFDKIITVFAPGGNTPHQIASGSVAFTPFPFVIMTVNQITQAIAINKCCSDT